MKVLIVDDINLDRATSIAKSLHDAGALVYVLHKGYYYDADQMLTNERAIPVLAFVHERDKTAFADTEAPALCCVSYSGGGADIPREMLAGFTDNEARHVVAQIAQGDGGDLKERVLAYWNGSPDKSALRLLCEAWVATRGNGCGEYDGISIHAPVTLDQWFAVFDGEQGQRPNGTEIAARMGDTCSETTDFFQAMTNGEDFSLRLQRLLTKLSAVAGNF